MISVCMATHNGCRYIIEQLNSITSQISATDEIIIVDDMSTDDTVSIIKHLEDKRIKLINNTENIGPIKSFEKALKICRGDVIFLADQDDVWDPNKVNIVMQVFNESNYSILIHDSRVTDEYLVEISHSWNKLNKNFLRPTLWQTLFKNSFTGANMAFKSNILDSVLPFPEGIPMHDWWIGAKCLKEHFQVCFIPNILMSYRRHAGNVTGNGHNLINMFKNRLRLALLLWRNR